MVRLPVEVEELILDHCIVSDNKANMAFMYSCALVCRAWAPRAQYNLFSSVFLNNANSQLFISALHRNPHLKYVTRSLEIDPDADVCSILVPLVGRLEFLEELTTSLNLGKENPALYMIAAQFHSIRKLTIVIRDKIVSTRNLIRLICCFPFLKDLSIYIPAGSILTDNPCAATTKSQIHLRRLFLRCRGFSGTTRLFDWLANSPSAIIDLRELKMVFSSAEELHRHSDEIARLLSRTGRSFLETSIVVLQARIPDTVTLLNALAPSNSANTRVSYIKFSMRPLSPNTIEYSVLFQYPTQTIRIIWRWTTPCHYLYYACYAKCRGPVSPSNAWNHEFCPRRSPLVSQASETKSLIDKNECYDNITIITRRIMRFCTTRSCFSLPSCTSTVARYDCTPHVGSPYSRLPKSRCSCTHPSRRSWRIQSQLRTQNTIPGPTHLHRRVQAWPVQNVVSLRITSCCMAGDLVLTESHMKACRCRYTDERRLNLQYAAGSIIQARTLRTSSSSQAHCSTSRSPEETTCPHIWSSHPFFVGIWSSLIVLLSGTIRIWDGVCANAYGGQNGSLESVRYCNIANSFELKHIDLRYFPAQCNLLSTFKRYFLLSVTSYWNTFSFSCIRLKQAGQSAALHQAPLATGCLMVRDGAEQRSGTVGRIWEVCLWCRRVSKCSCVEGLVCVRMLLARLNALCSTSPSCHRFRKNADFESLPGRRHDSGFYIDRNIFCTSVGYGILFDIRGYRLSFSCHCVRDNRSVRFVRAKSVRQLS